MKMRKRLLFVDYLKGFSITLVVIFHVIDGLRLREVLAEDSFLVFTAQLIGTFRMPLFFFISGYLSTKILRQLSSEFAMNNLVTLVVPYFLWSYVYLITSSLFSDAVIHHHSSITMIKIFLPWDSVSVYWFLYSLFIARLTYFLCGKQRLVSVFLLFFAVSALPLKEYIGGYIDEQIFNAIDRICLAGTFVGFGLIAASYDNVGAFLHARWSGLVFGFCWASLVVVLAQLGVFGTAAHLASDAWTTSVVWAVCAFSGAVFWFSVARQFEDKFKLRLGLLVDIGRASIAIYVMHIFFIVAMRTLLLKLGFRDATLHLVAETMVGIFIPMAAFFLANWLRIAPYVGFGKNMRPARVAVQKDEKATAGSN